jgi:hypothetical protein
MGRGIRVSKFWEYYMSKIKRKFCHLHGWAPHVVTQYATDLWFEDYITHKVCCRCHPPAGLTKVQKIKNFLKGFSLPERVKARDFVRGRFD